MNPSATLEAAKAIPEDVMQAAREAAAKVWGSDTGSEELAAEFRRGMRDDSGSVETAVVAILAERERCKSLAEAHRSQCIRLAKITRQMGSKIQFQVAAGSADEIAKAIDQGALPADMKGGENHG